MTIEKRYEVFALTYGVSRPSLSELRDYALVAVAGVEKRRRTRRALMRLQRLRRPRLVLSDAVARMHDVDLESAFTAALRGDLSVTYGRISGYVSERARATEKKGTPWRQSGWLSKR